MSGKDAFRVEGVIMACCGGGRFKLRLVNGHRLMGYVVRRDLPFAQSLAVGKAVSVQLTPYDLSKGRIQIGEADKQFKVTHESKSIGQTTL